MSHNCQTNLKYSNMLKNIKTLLSAIIFQSEQNYETATEDADSQIN